MKKLTLFSIAVLMIMMTAVGFVSNAKAESPDGKIVSAGLKIIANKSDMAICGVTDNEISLSPEKFERALNVSKIDYVRIKKLPDENLGKLCLGSNAMSENEVVFRENIHKISYVPKEKGIAKDSFSFDTGNGYSIDCSVYMLKKENFCPKAIASELTSNVVTHRNVSVYGTMQGNDADGDKIKYEVVSYPKNGILTVIDEESGEFCYNPYDDFVGNDSFKYVVKDIYGNYSKSEIVDLKVNRSKMQNVLSDMGGNKAHSSAITMVENEIMTAENKEGKLVFSPNEKVTREDFLVMAMKAAGMNLGDDFSNADSTFADNDKISDYAKPYVALAQKKGIIKGTKIADRYYFNPTQNIQAAQAALILDNMIDGKKYVNADMTIETIFVDHIEIPVWAESSIRTLNYIGVFADKNGYVYPAKELTRGNVAIILENIVRLCKE